MKASESDLAIEIFIDGRVIVCPYYRYIIGLFHLSSPLETRHPIGLCSDLVSSFVSNNTLIFSNTNLKQTRDYLLPKLISGKVDVSDLDIDTGMYICYVYMCMYVDQLYMCINDYT